MRNKIKYKKRYCKHCRKEIPKYNISLEVYNKKDFCCRKCYFEYHNTLVKCKNCNKTFKVQKSLKYVKKFCSNECRKQYRQKYKYTCAFCKKIVDENTDLKHGNIKFCSHACYIKYYGLQNIVFCPRCKLPIYTKLKHQYKYTGSVYPHHKCQKYMKKEYLKNWKQNIIDRHIKNKLR